MRWTFLLCILLLFDAVWASPEITSWYNNKTGNSSLAIAVDTEDTMFFNTSANETVNWTWLLNGVSQGINQGYWSYNFPSYGIYNVSVSGSNDNGSTQAINWTIIATLRFTDALGNNISISKKPQRIVSLAPSNTEILFALDLGSKVIGVTDYCDYPPEAQNREKVGGFYNPNVEKVEILEPELILASNGNDITVVNKLIDDCKTLNCTVIGLDATNVDEIIENIELIGKIADVSSGNLVLDTTTKINAVKNKTSSLTEAQKLKVLYTIWYNPIYTAGNGTYAHDLIQRAGGVNIASDLNDWAIINPEIVLSRNPEVILCSGMALTGIDICNSIKNDAVLKQVDAIKMNQVYVISDPNIVERPGPRIASGLETIYAFLNLSVKSPPPTQPPSAGGGSSTPQTPTATITDGQTIVNMPSISAGSTVSVQIPEEKGVDITEISIQAKKSANDAKVVIGSLDSLPSSVATPGGEIYCYLEVSKQNIDDESVENIAFKFKVEKAWVADNEIDTKTIKLRRYSNGQWSELQTSKSGEDTTYLYFTANSPGLSYFSITGEKLVPVASTPAPSTPAPTTPAPTTPAPTTPAPTTPASTTPAAVPTMGPAMPTLTQEKKGVCGPTVVSLIGILPMILYRQLRKKR